MTVIIPIAYKLMLYLFSSYISYRFYKKLLAFRYSPVLTFWSLYIWISIEGYINVEAGLYKIFPQELLFLLNGIAFLLIFFKGTLYKKVLVEILSLSIGNLCQFIPLPASYYITKLFNSNGQIAFFYKIFDILVLLMVAVSLEYIGNKFQKLHGAIPVGCSVYLTVLASFLSRSVVLLGIQYMDGMIRADRYELFPAFFISLYAVAGLVLMIFSIYYIEQRLTLLLIEQQALLQTRHFKAMEKKEREAAGFRHDLNNHLICLERLLAGGSYEEAKSYLSSVSKAARTIGPGFSTGNLYADAVLQEKYSQAMAEGIQMEIAATFPQKESVNPMDICIILCNALDNAIEACGRMSGDVPRMIRLKAFCSRAYLVIEIENPFQREPQMADGKLISQKRRQSLHGIGMENINAAIERLRGTSDFTIRDGKFLFQAMIPVV